MFGVLSVRTTYTALDCSQAHVAGYVLLRMCFANNFQEAY